MNGQINHPLAYAKNKLDEEQFPKLMFLKLKLPKILHKSTRKVK
jgi:hypothetical protein